MKIAQKAFRRGVMFLSRVVVPKRVRRIKNVRSSGLELLAFVNEDVGRQLWLFNSFEPEETKFFRQLIKADDICIDVGGNIGYFSMLMGQCAYNGEVHVFEPIPLNAKIIAANAALNNLENIIINNVALAGKKGRSEFSVSVDSAYSSLHDTGRKSEEKVINVALWTLDDYTAECNLKRIAIMKVDVEGAEGMVLEGASILLGDPKRRPQVVMLELQDINLVQFETNVASVVEKMIGFGYVANVLSNKVNLLPYSPSMANKYYNVFFTI